MKRDKDMAAIHRLRKLLKNPGPELQTLREAIGDSFYRLYRQRNLILHENRGDSVFGARCIRWVAYIGSVSVANSTRFADKARHRRRWICRL